MLMNGWWLPRCYYVLAQAVHHTGVSFYPSHRKTRQLNIAKYNRATTVKPLCCSHPFTGECDRLIGRKAPTLHYSGVFNMFRHSAHFTLLVTIAPPKQCAPSGSKTGYQGNASLSDLWPPALLRVQSISLTAGDEGHQSEERDSKP